MDHRDRQAIEGLFDKVAQAGHAQPHRDPEAEALIADRIARNPGAAYYLAQTVIMQEQALNAAQAQMEQGRTQQGGLFGGLFGGAQARPSPSTSPRAEHRPQDGGQAQASPAAGPWGGRRASGGGGFLAGAAQTAMGVAGGVLLGNAIGGMFAGPADAAEAVPEEGSMEDETQYDDGGFDDGGFE